MTSSIIGQCDLLFTYFIYSYNVYFLVQLLSVNTMFGKSILGACGYTFFHYRCGIVFLFVNIPQFIVYSIIEKYFFFFQLGSTLNILLQIYLYMTLVNICTHLCWVYTQEQDYQVIEYVHIQFWKIRQTTFQCGYTNLCSH